MNLFNNKYIKLSLIMGLSFIIRLAYSLTTEFWYPDQDVLQIYLIGLKFYTTGAFPYFGPDLVYTKAQIPGSLQAILVSVGWFFKEIPESPFIVLNLLLTLSLALFAWYLSKRTPNIKKWIIWVWVVITPWSMFFFTKIVNPSYVIPGAILFFIGIFETIPILRTGAISENISLFFQGFALFWIFQLHMSWVLLLPFIAISFYYQLRHNILKVVAKRITMFLLGCITTGIFVLPTLIKYGLSNQNGTSTASVIHFNFANMKEGFTYLIKYLSYACFDTTRFFGADPAQRIEFLKTYIWASPFTVIVTLFGVFQIIFLLISFFRKVMQSAQWKYIKILTIFGFVIFYFSSWFSVTSPAGHAAVLYFPLVMIYSLHCYEKYLNRRYVKNIIIAIFVSSILLSIAIAHKNYSTISIYKNRHIIEKALIQKDYQLVGKRRYDN